MKPQTPIAHAIIGFIIVGGLLNVGCTPLNLSESLDFDLSKNIPWTLPDDQGERRPDKLIAIWTDAVLHQEGAPSMRGFGGRIMFYKSGGSKAVKTSGDLTVYAFDESKRDYATNQPDRRYVIPAEKLAKLHSLNDLGDSYSVWIPWDQVGGPSVQLSLVARLKTEEGHTVVSEMTTHLLPGRDPAPESTAETDVPPTIQQTSLNQRFKKPSQGFQATTIPLSPQLTNRLTTIGPKTGTLTEAEFSPKQLPPAASNPTAPAMPSQPAPSHQWSWGRHAQDVNSIPQPAATRQQPAGGFPRQQPRVLGAPLEQPRHGHVRWGQSRLAPASAPASPSQSNLDAAS